MSEEKISTSNVLTYGATILINHPSNDDLMIFSDGMVKSQLFLKDFEQPTGKKSFYRSLFQIYPSFLNTHKTEALALKETKDKGRNISQNKREKLEELKEKLTFEYKFDREHFEKVRNTPVAYDTSIQFLHLASNKFLACHFVEAQVEKENYRLELVDVPHEATNFKILPSYKHQKENDGHIYYKDPVFIVCATNHLNKVPYMRCSYQEANSATSPTRTARSIETQRSRQPESGKRSFIQNKLEVEVPTRFSKPEDVMDSFAKREKKKEVNVSLSSYTRWRINLFSREESDSDNEFLLYGEIIWMNHAEQNASMIARKEKNGIFEVDFLKTTIFDNSQQEIGNTNGMWIIENENYRKGGFVQWEDRFRLKHFSSGRYLSVSYNPYKKNYELKLDTPKTEDSLFKFVLMSTTANPQVQNYYKYISKEAFTRIQSASADLWLHVEKVGDKMEACLLPYPFDDDIFKLVKANNNEVWETNFLISCFPILQNYLSSLEETLGKNVIVEDQNSQQKFEKRIKEAQECLVQLDLFCTNRLLNTSSDQSYGDVNPYRQKVLREQYFLETLGEILKFSFSASEFEKYLSDKADVKNPKGRKGSAFRGLVKKVKIASGKVDDMGIMEEKIEVCKLIYKLIKSICKDNAENEFYAYNIIYQFQFHAKYLEEAVDCFISIIAANETILTKISEGIKVEDVMKELTHQQEVLIGTKKQVGVFNLRLVFDNKERIELKPTNFVVFFLKLIYDNSTNHRNINFLRFLKTICICSGKGITINQELLYKLFTVNPSLDESTFMITNIHDDELYIQINDRDIVSLEDGFQKENPALNWEKETAYFLEQLEFYSNLLNGRNYLWKMKLEKQFPIKFVFDQICNENLSLKIRSVFCDLALTLHVDQEPLNPRMVPNLCRVFNKKNAKTGAISQADKKKLEEIDKENFANLLRNIMKIIQDQKMKIMDELEKKCEDPQTKKIKVSNYLNNVVLVKLIKLISQMTMFDLLRLLDGTISYYQVVQDLVHILEFDRNYPTYNYALIKLRDENKKGANAKKPQGMGVFGGLAGIVGDFSKGVVGTMKDVATTMFGEEKKKLRNGGGNFVDDADEGVFYNNPLMKGLILLRNQLDQHTTERRLREVNNEILIKEEICDLFNYLLDLRQDFLLSNLTGWFEETIPKINAKLDNDDRSQIIKDIVEQNVETILPDIARTGIFEIDEKYKIKEEKAVLNVFQLLRKKSQFQKSTKFVKYTLEPEIPDLDTLFTGVNNQNINEYKQILPSLLVTFHLTNDTALENKLLTLIMRLFNQREELTENMKNLEMIFEKQDVAIYNEVEVWIEELRLQTQRSELWLNDFILSKGEKDEELNKVIDLFKNIQGIMTHMYEGSEKHSKSRQSMVRNFSGYSPMIGIIKDGVFHLQTALTDPTFPEEKKQKLLEMFTLSHSSLASFCVDNPTNQKLLSADFNLFLSNLNIDMGQIPLICEICRDNKFICESFGDVIIDGIMKAIVQYGRKASFLDPLARLQRHRAGVLFENYIKILNNFLPTNRALQERELIALYAAIDQDMQEIEFVFQKELFMDEPFDYHSKLLKVLMLEGDGSENLTFTHSRLRKILTIPYCLRLIRSNGIPKVSSPTKKDLELYEIGLNVDEAQQKPSFEEALTTSTKKKIEDKHQEGLRVLKPQIINLMSTLYLKADKILAEEFLEHLDLFTELIKSEKKAIEELPEEHVPTADSSYYLFGILLHFIKEYVERLIIGNRDEARDRRDSHAILELVELIYSRFAHLSNGMTREEALTFKALAKHFIDESHIPNNQVPDIIDTIIRSNFSRHEYTSHVSYEGRGRGSKFEHNKTDPRRKVSPSTYWLDLIRNTIHSKILLEGIEDERTVLSEAIWNVHKIFPEEYKTKFKIEIEAKDILRKLIDYLRDGLKNKADTNTMISTLRVLRKMIDTAPNKTEMQNFFDKHDATRMLLSVLSDPKHTIIEDNLLNEYIEFGISLLDEGNQNVQKAIFNYCNIHSKSEVMFAKFHSIIYEQIDYLQRKAEMKKEGIRTAELEHAHSVKSLILEKLLRFLQLFTEGHYLDLQNYLRHQTNSRNRYNLVEAVTELLKTYYSDLVQANYENIVKCLDTLNEFVQGPCYENQLALIDGKFFEVVNGLLIKDIKTTKAGVNRRRSEKKRLVRNSTYFVSSYSANPIFNSAQQNRELEAWMLARLKYKVLILVSSLFERSSSAVIKRIMRSLPLDVLKKNLTKIYKKYKRMYGDNYAMEALKHFEGNPLDSNEDPPEGYYELIIEAGFLIYFLICSYTDVDIQDADVDIEKEIQEMREEFDYTNYKEKKENALTQLGRFIYTISISTIETIKEIKEKFRNRDSLDNRARENEEREKLKKSIEKKELVREAMRFFSKNSASIEVLRDQKVEKVRFMLLPYCHELSKEVKKEFNENVNRQNTKTKVEGLVKESEKIIDVCKHELRLKLFFNKRKFLAIFANFVNLWKDLAYLLSVTLNLMILSSFSEYFGDPGDYENGRLSDPVLFLSASIETERTNKVFLAFGIAMTFCSCFVVLFFLLKRAPMIAKKAWDVQTPVENPGFVRKSLLTLAKIIKSIYFSLQSIEILYYVAYGALAIIGTVFHPFFFAFHLTEIAFRYPTLKSVIKSVWMPKKQLGLVLLLYLVLNYFFTIYAYSYLHELYQGDCESSIMCWRYTFDWTLKGNGGIGGVLLDVTPIDQGIWDVERTKRFIFENLANIILVIIMLNIVSGIIIDTFGFLREKEEEKLADIHGKCFVCGLSKDIFDRQADSNYNFLIHLKREHYMWNYVFFIAYLKDKDETEYTGMESYIDEKIKNMDYTWFPFNRALALKHQDETEGEITKEVRESFHSEAEEIKKSVKVLNDAYTTLAARLNPN